MSARTSITRGEAKQLLMSVRQAARASDEAHFEFCCALHAIYYGVVGKDDQPVWESYGYGSWHDFVEKEVGLHSTTTLQMVSTAHFYTVRMVDVWEGQILPRQMMRALASAGRKIVTKENFEAWMRRAMDMTPCDFEHALAGKHRKKHLGFSFDADTTKKLKTLLDDVCEEQGFTNRSDALLDLLGELLKDVKVKAA